ncbi:DNA repair ATPase [Streptomyces sp. NPDC001255]|uniref:DNA repair ATPase n=1 Tax=Streptomyces sp. NPDC001255 TaxID=3364550 RepID=UPI00369C126D
MTSAPGAALVADHSRLRARTDVLATRLAALDAARREAFGGTDVVPDRHGEIGVPRPAHPGDLLAVAPGTLLLGQVPGPGTVRGEPEVGDVLRLYDGKLRPLAEDAVPGLLDDPAFRREFAALHRYFRRAALVRLRRVPGRLLAVFRTGEREGDLKVLRWEDTGDGTYRFLDAAGEREHAAAGRYDVDWHEAGRADHVPGRNPHVRLAGGALYVSTVGGRLTVKTENDTETKDVLHEEPVDEPFQSLGDAEFAHAEAGALLLLRVRPYKEEPRYFVFHPLTRRVTRLDALGRSFRRLPGGEGLVYPGGYVLATGEVRRFDLTGREEDGPRFEQEVASPDGEQVLYVFRATEGGPALLLPYHRVRKEVATPLTTHGHALLDDGTLYALEAPGTEATTAHAVRAWRTPFAARAREAEAADPLARIGAAALVRGIADCLDAVRLARAATGDAGAGDAGAGDAARGGAGAGDAATGNARTGAGGATEAGASTPDRPTGAGAGAGAETGAGAGTAAADSPTEAPTAFADATTEPAHQALLTACDRALDRHPWLAADDLPVDLRTPLREVRDAARRTLESYATVRALAAESAAEVARAAEEVRGLLRRVAGEPASGVFTWVERLTELRRAQGSVLALAGLRHVDTTAVDALAAETGQGLDTTARRALAALEDTAAFTAQEEQLAAYEAEAHALEQASAATELTARVDDLAAGLRTLTETLTSLDGTEATARTRVLHRVTGLLGGLNRARALAAGRAEELGEAEQQDAFAAEFALFGQAVTGALAAAHTPEDCESGLTALLARLEGLEARFAGQDAFLTALTEKRAEVSDAFAGRGQSLRDARARRAERLADSARSLLATVARRAADTREPAALAAYFASDPMPLKVRDVVRNLRALGDSVRADELEARLAAVQEEARRALRDRGDLYEDDGATVRLGRHRFAVTRETPVLTLVPAPEGDGLVLALTGTDHRTPVTDPVLTSQPDFWSQELPSENADVYRAEHLAARLFAAHGPASLAARTTEERAALVREEAAAAYDEGHEPGVHDHDAALLLEALLELGLSAGLLRHPAADRAAARLYWTHGPEDRDALARACVSLTRARDTFGVEPGALTALRARLAAHAGSGVWGDGLSEEAAAYLIEQLASDSEDFVVGPGARALLAGFRAHVGTPPYAEEARERLAADDPEGAAALVRGWLEAYVRGATDREAGPETDGDLAEAVALELCEGRAHDVSAPDALQSVKVTGLLGTHPRLTPAPTGGRELTLRIDEFLPRTHAFRTTTAPAFRAYQRHRTRYLAEARAALGLDGYVPRVAGSFVRGRLVDEVYLPLVGDNLAKQLGTAGAGRRTDRGGLLLLLSPPGYGKTTLTGWVAARLGLLHVRVDGPALGGATTSLDPDRAPDEGARRELEKLRFALTAGNNVLLHIDDIQHLSPRLLQQFIPLCDTSRTLDGHDLRGKRFAVVMTGNPYTESGESFHVPDMLASRADVWNLGDVLRGKEDAFALSFLENALTAHPSLAPLASRAPADIPALLADTATEHAYGPAERAEIRAVLGHLAHARTTLLRVNAAYIASAARTGAARTEPRFQLQGSYRDMNKIAARVTSGTTPEELESLLTDHYRAEAQTLGPHAEASLLKLAHLRGDPTPEERARWQALCEAERRTSALAGTGDDPVGRAVALLADRLADRLAGVERAIAAVREENRA